MYRYEKETKIWKWIDTYMRDGYVCVDEILQSYCVNKVYQYQPNKRDRQFEH